MLAAVADAVDSDRGRDSNARTTLLERYAAVARAELPAGTDVFDAHTHLGDDIDGMIGDRDELLAIQRAYGIARSFVFCLDEPDRHPAFTAANDRTLAHGAAGAGRARSVRPARPGRDPDRGGDALPRRSARAASSSTRARSASFPTTRGSSRCSPSPPSAACPS